MARRKDLMQSNPHFFPQDSTPVCILKAKNGHYHFLTEMPTASRSYLWYMTEPQLVSFSSLELEMQKSNRRWYATDRESYALQCKVQASTTSGEPYVCLRDVRIKEENRYWFGPRHGEPPTELVSLIMTVADIYLKSELHQRQLMRVLLEHVRRVLETHKVFRSGRTMIEVRGASPTPSQLAVLSLLPGIAKIYAPHKRESTNDSNNTTSSSITTSAGSATQNNKCPPVTDAIRTGGDPRGNVLRHGAGGIPILPDQTVLALISGGIDSPVAAYRMMTRGCHVNGIHFLNSTNSTASVIAKNRRICEQLSRIQGTLEMFYVDISSLQSQIVALVANHNRTLLYKWFMLSLSASFDQSKLLVTGDSLGQVASQTIFNISTLYGAVTKAVVAPLIGMHKTYIMDEARRIGTYNYSIQHGDDCCQYMMCKTGANLWIGRRALLTNLNRITLSTLPVTREVYMNGVLTSTQSYTYTPNAGPRKPLIPLAPIIRPSVKAKAQAQAKAKDGTSFVNHTDTSNRLSYMITENSKTQVTDKSTNAISNCSNSTRAMPLTSSIATVESETLVERQLKNEASFLCKCNENDNFTMTTSNYNDDINNNTITSNGHVEMENEYTTTHAIPTKLTNTSSEDNKYKQYNINEQEQQEQEQEEEEEEEWEEEETTIYFDAAAGTKMPNEVREAMFAATEANPNSLYTSGRKARMAMEQVRSELALMMRVPVSDIIFTSGGTESNNIALHGYGVEREAWSHASTSGASAETDSNNNDSNNNNKRTLVRVIDLVNHETGSVNTNFKRPDNGRLHVDACQALTKIDFSTLDMSQVDSMSVSAHKINGPIGVGALYLRDLHCHKMYHGGSQEHGIRPGTENVPAIVGFGAALRLNRSHSIHREIEEFIVDVLLNLGCEVDRRGETSGFIVHATLPVGVNNTQFVSLLSTKYHVEIGTGSACKTHEVNNTVYETLHKTPAPDRAIRISWDCFATLQQAEAVAQAIKDAMRDLRRKRECDQTEFNVNKN